MFYCVAGHNRAVITARDTTAPTIPRDDITASDFTARDITAYYLYRARYYRAYFLNLKNKFYKTISKAIGISIFL
jgi:hypothetical protein